MSVLTNKRHASDPSTLETTSLNSLTTTGIVTGAAVDPGGYMFGDFELNITYPSAPTDNSVIELLLLRSIDGGSTYEDANGASGGVAGGFQLDNITTAQKLVIRGVVLPPGHFKPYIVAKTTGQTAASSGNTLKLTRYTPEST